MSSFLTSRLGIKPSGANGTWTRRDHLRAAAFDFAAAVGFLGVMYVYGSLRSNIQIDLVILIAAILVLLALAAGAVRLLFAAVGWPR